MKKLITAFAALAIISCSDKDEPVDAISLELEPQLELITPEDLPDFSTAKGLTDKYAEVLYRNSHQVLIYIPKEDGSEFTVNENHDFKVDGNTISFRVQWNDNFKGKYPFHRLLLFKANHGVAKGDKMTYFEGRLEKLKALMIGTPGFGPVWPDYVADSPFFSSTYSGENRIYHSDIPARIKHKLFTFQDVAVDVDKVLLQKRVNNGTWETIEDGWGTHLAGDQFEQNGSAILPYTSPSHIDTNNMDDWYQFPIGTETSFRAYYGGDTTIKPYGGVHTYVSIPVGLYAKANNNGTTYIRANFDRTGIIDNQSDVNIFTPGVAILEVEETQNNWVVQEDVTFIRPIATKQVAVHEATVAGLTGKRIRVRLVAPGIDDRTTEHIKL